MENEYITDFVSFKKFWLAYHIVSWLKYNSRCLQTFELLICAMKANMHIQMSKSGKGKGSRTHPKDC